MMERRMQGGLFFASVKTAPPPRHQPTTAVTHVQTNWDASNCVDLLVSLQQLEQLMKCSAVCNTNSTLHAKKQNQTA